MLRIDHVALGVQNLYEGVERLRAETEFGDADGGWFPGVGVANRIMPLAEQQYLEVESVIDATTAQRSTGGRWFSDQLAFGDVFLGWCAAVDTRAELERYATWFDVPIQETATRVTSQGWVRSSPRTPNAPVTWQHGLPNVFCMDPETHPARHAVAHSTTPRGISWMEIGGTEADMRAWLGEAAVELPLRYNGRPHGLYAVAVTTADGERVIRRRPALPDM